MITVTSEKFKNLDYPPLSSSDGTDYLLGSVGDKIQATIDFYVKVSAEDITLVVAETTANNTLRRTDSGSFLKDGFRIGNSLTVQNIGADAGNYVVSNVTDKVITISTTFTTKTTYFNTYVYRTNLVTAGDYFYNLIENDAPDSFVSLVDSETQQRYSVSGITATGTTGTYTITSNSKAWAIDQDGYGVTILGTGISDFKQSFRITQVFIITPIAFYSQLENLQNGIPPAPDYFADRKCLRHVCKIDMKIERTDPEIVDTVTFSRKGNTAWFDEFLNGEPPTYSVSAPTYTFGGDSVDEIQYDVNTATVGTWTVTSANSSFGTGTTAVLHIIYLPNNPADYTNTQNKFRQVFAYDRAALTCGAAASAGINLLSSYSNYRQIFLAQATYVSATQITVAAQFKYKSALTTILGDADTDNRNYLVFITVQDPSITTVKGTDRNALIADVNSYDKDLDDSTLFTINPNVKYYNSAGGLLGSSANVYGGDIVRAVVPFQVKNSGSQLLYNIGVRTDAVYTGATGTFTIEEWSADTRDYCLDDGVQEISITQSKGYQLPSDNVNNQITVSRYTALDTATQAGYLLSFPFIVRYETWRPMDDADCDFGDATQDWSVISNKSGWSIKQYITATVYDPATDHETPFEQTCEINVATIGATGSTGTWCVITTYDDLGVNNQGGDILDYENTLVYADFYGAFGALPAGATGYVGMLYLDQQSIGGVNWVYPFSSYEDLRLENDSSPWIGATGTTGTCSIVQISATHIRATAKLDWKKLNPSINNYNLRAKLEYLT